MHHLIKTTELANTEWTDVSEAPLAAGKVRLKIDAFALTANNVTYATFGGAPMFYWNFFPSPKPDYGRVPVWGFAEIIDSQVAGIDVGRRVYGYLPISTTLDIEPARLTAHGFMDGAAHRKDLSPIYNTYSYNDSDPAYDAAYEAQQMLFRPLYLTGWMICDCLVNGDPAPQSVVLSSASSKTALATAHGLQARGIETIGLTSPGNKGFVVDSGLYSNVLTYDEVSTLPNSGRVAYVDFVGRPALTHAIHSQCGDAMVRSLMIGATDWEADRTMPDALPGPAPEFFFVPTYAAERAKELPPGALNAAMQKDLIAFYPISEALVTPEHIKGPDAISAAWIDSVAGKVAPRRGLICSL